MRNDKRIWRGRAAIATGEKAMEKESEIRQAGAKQVEKKAGGGKT